MLLLSESDLSGVRHPLATGVAMPVRRSNQVLEDVQAGVTAAGPSAYHGCKVTYSVCGQRKRQGEGPGTPQHCHPGEMSQKRHWAGVPSEQWEDEKFQKGSWQLGACESSAVTPPGTLSCGSLSEPPEGVLRSFPQVAEWGDRYSRKVAVVAKVEPRGRAVMGQEVGSLTRTWRKRTEVKCVRSVQYF